MDEARFNHMMARGEAQRKRWEREANPINAISNGFWIGVGAGLIGMLISGLL